MKKNVALVTGGYSGESVISYQSAENVLAHIDLEKYNVYLIDICKDEWFYKDAAGIHRQIDRTDFSLLEDGQNIRFDVALMCIHGTPGEDGKLLGYFDMVGLPYTSCNAAVSALTFNKSFTVAVAGRAGVNVARSVLLFKEDRIDLERIKSLKFPVFVKPNNGGSSIGMSKVSISEDGAILEALKKAFDVDVQVLVEEGISGREFTIGVLRNENGEIVTLPMTEIILKKGRETFDFEAKYSGETDEVTPAVAPAEIALMISDAAKNAYRALNCSGIVRIDFIYDSMKKAPFMLEVNTVPGQTRESLIPKQVKARGWKLTEFYSNLIETALLKK